MSDVYGRRPGRTELNPEQSRNFEAAGSKLRQNENAFNRFLRNAWGALKAPGEGLSDLLMGDRTENVGADVQAPDTSETVENVYTFGDRPDIEEDMAGKLGWDGEGDAQTYLIRKMQEAGYDPWNGKIDFEQFLSFMRQVY